MAFRPVHFAEQSAVKFCRPALRAVVVENCAAGDLPARAAAIGCVGFAPAKWLAELAEAGTVDLIPVRPPGARTYANGLSIARGSEPAGGARE
jgi:hypothetical protein